MRVVHRIGMLVVALAVVAGIPVLGAAPAEATTYRYWSYWHSTSGSWAFSGVGAAGWRVSDGSVEGWRFAVSVGTRSAPKPRYDASSAFGALCSGVARTEGMARVALVVDFGTAEDARPGDDPKSPSLRGACVSVATTGSPPTGLRVLNDSGTNVREEDGLICGLAGYPSVGCAEVVRVPVSSPTPTPSATPTRTRTPTPTSRPTSPSVAPGSTPTSAAPTATASTSGGSTPSSGAATTSASPSGTSASVSASGSATSATAVIDGPSSSATDDDAGSPVLVTGLADDSAPPAGTPWPFLAGSLLIAGIGSLAWWTSRRRGAP